MLQKNVYADAVLNIFNQNENNILPLDEKYLSQFNYLPTKSGKIFNDNYKLLSGKKSFTSTMETLFLNVLQALQAESQL